MRIECVELAWFRGSAEPVSLEPKCRSMVVYGANGSGKSSFVDAVEYALNEGKIGHLAHEYSGRHQEKAVVNTHKPAAMKTELRIGFKGGSDLKIEIEKDGSSKRSGTQPGAMTTWDYRRTVLRQDEVAAFIHDTKGAKYSALLPLLGLSEMEVAAENLRQLARAVEQQSKLKETRAVLRETDEKRRVIFGADSDDLIVKKIGDIHSKYCADKGGTKDALARCAEVEAELEERTARFSADERRYLALRGAAELDLKGQVESVRRASVALAGAAEPLITERLEVLHSTATYADGLRDETEVQCPACGRTIRVDVFQAHVKAERNRLRAIIAAFDARRAAIGTLCDTLKSLRTSVGKADARTWRDGLAKGSLVTSFAYLDGLKVELIRTSCGDENLREIEGRLLPVVEAAAVASKEAPADVQEMARDRKTVESGRGAITASKQSAAVARAEALLSFLHALEQGVREEIRLRSQVVIDGISSDIQEMWSILHPGECIEDVRLYVPKDADKAIDIGLKFYGLPLDSPRLTLSEGYRNSLGLCIFLAMAKREAEHDRPVFLDDVVVSMDRHHRGMIVEVLDKMFGGRQVILLTHDRDWYAELRHLLDDKNWTFRTLLPYETPGIGIRWSHKTTTFDDARAQLKERPDSAGNDARKIMDVELMPIAEHLRIRVEYLRGDRNDRRMSHDLLERIIAEGKRCFERRTGAVYTSHKDAIDAFEKADGLLVAWANRASHGFDIAPPEAVKLIDTCEAALGFFKCASCGKSVWYAHADAVELVQCGCGEIRWRYGKG